jgi:non-ribosomal peptide synthase protein (TIGR01720 family)
MVPELLPLTGSQEWLLSEMMKMNHPGYVSIEFMLKTKVRMDDHAIHRASEFVANRYENLRVKFGLEEGHWVQRVYPVSEGAVSQTYDLSNASPAQDKVATMRDLCMRIRDWITPESGNLFKIVFFKFSDTDGRIWFYMHHLISDFVSTLHVSTDFMNAYMTIMRNGELKLKTVTDYRKWQYIVDGYSRDVLIPSELQYWLTLPWHKAKTPPSDFPDTLRETEVAEAIAKKRLINHHKELWGQVDCDTTQSLTATFGNDLETALLAVFFIALSNHFDVECLDLTVSHSGRNILPHAYEVSDNKLVGFVAGARILLLERPVSSDSAQQVHAVMEQIRRIPNNGIGYSLIGKALKNDQLKKSFQTLRKSAQILFNYLGRVSTSLRNDSYEIVTEDVGKDFYPREIRNSLIECVLEIRNSELRYSITYIELYHTESTIRNLLDGMGHLLKAVAQQGKDVASSVHFSQHIH